jgi:hypothetical protein
MDPTQYLVTIRGENEDDCHNFIRAIELLRKHHEFKGEVSLIKLNRLM